MATTTASPSVRLTPMGLWIRWTSWAPCWAEVLLAQAALAQKLVQSSSPPEAVLAGAAGSLAVALAPVGDSLLREAEAAGLAAPVRRSEAGCWRRSWPRSGVLGGTA